MSSFISTAERSGILAVFSDSFDTWSRAITIYKEPIKVEITPQPSTNNNAFGFGESQQDPIYTYLPARTGVFMAILKDGDIASAVSQTSKAELAPEIMNHIVASPLSMKVRKEAHDFIEDGETSKIIDNSCGDTYLLNGYGCLQTILGSEYYVYPLRKTK